MNKEAFSQYAANNRLPCGTHYIVYKGKIEVFIIWADSYKDPMKWEVLPTDKSYHATLLLAAGEQSTLYEKK